MKKFLSILMITLTLFWLVLPVAAVDGEDIELEELEESLGEELFRVDESIDSMETVCYDPLMNYINNDEGYIEEPSYDFADDTQNNFISPYIIADPTEGSDINVTLTSLVSDQLLHKEDGYSFKNLIDVDGETNVSYLQLLLSQKYPGCYNIRIHSQGACSDGEYLYNALTVQYAYNGVWHKENCIVSGVYDDDDFITTSIRFTSDMIASNCLAQKDDLKHINGMTYNGLRDKLVIACAEDGYHNEVYMLDAAYFRGDTEVLPSVKKHELSCMITSIAYNEKRNKYVSMLKNSDMFFVVFDSDFNLIAGCNYADTMTEQEEGTEIWLSHQDICCDDNYIYATYFKRVNDDLENFLVRFDWNGNLKKEINLNTTSVEHTYWDENKGRNITLISKYEIEGISILNDRIILNFNVFWRDKNDLDGDKTTYVYLYDLSDKCFNIKYCPDDNVATHINNGDLKNNTVIHGISTKLLDNTYMNYGYEFMGWHLYSPETNKWRYENEALNKTGWYVEGSQPANYEKIVYPEKTSVKQTVPAGMNLMLCAVWEETDKFYISYDGNGETSGLMNAQAMIYGQKNYLNANTFTKTVNGEAIDFLGWNPYSPEVNKWYYESADKSHRAWYVEGEEPTGYTKVLYTNGGSVRQTTNPGGHIVLFALWNEFTIYYDAGGKLIKSEKEHILLPTVVHKGIQVQLKQYSLSSIDGKETDVPDAFNGYHQYHVESERWRYVRDDNTTVWLTNSDTLQLYTYPYGTIRNGLTAGQRVVFSADWS